MTPPELDQLIEEGLTLYGQGDLDGALLAWEKALAVDPENAQANSYVDYVRQNYDLLTGETQRDESSAAPFGFDDEPYQIEILPSELEYLRPSERNITKADVDEGWFMDDESAPRRTLVDGEPAQVSFEDQTREYQNASRAPAEISAADSGRGEFGEIELTPSLDSQRGFASQPTNLRERETGFVKATGRAHRPSQVPSEIQMTLRTPGETTDPFSTMSIPKIDNLPAEQPPASSSISLSYDDPPTAERTLSPSAAELINSLPSPTPRGHPNPTLDPATGLPRTGTAELPPSLRPPAISEAGTFPMPSTMTRDTITRDFESQKTNAAMPKVSTTPTREMVPGELPINPLFGGREMVSAPTRDLGLRPLNITPVLPEEDRTVTTTRKAAPAVGEGTRADLILPFDPIDARSAQILDEIDEGEPENEAKEDRTRRRVTLLFEKALAWSQTGELDKAVAAIDLALSEDPNSALGQKLVHRHRDQMLQVFQAFLGDLERQPVLARPLHELANAPISPRAAFLLSRIDGMVTLDELLDVSGMPRIEAYRYLCQLFLRGILR